VKGLGAGIGIKGNLQGEADRELPEDREKYQCRNAESKIGWGLSKPSPRNSWEELA